MLKTMVCHWIYPPYKLESLPVTVSWMLAENISLLVQRQRAVLLWAQQAAYPPACCVSLFAPSCLTGDTVGSEGGYACSGFASQLRNTEFREFATLIASSNKAVLCLGSNVVFSLKVAICTNNPNKWPSCRYREGIAHCSHGMLSKMFKGNRPKEDCVFQQKTHPLIL